MAILLAVVVMASVHGTFGQNLASCSTTVCPGAKECRIIERCWGKDCQIGTTCIAPADLPVDRSNYQCNYDSPALRSLDGGMPVELKCGSSNPLNMCPQGTECIEPVGVCCTGSIKNTGSCPPVRGYYYLFNGDCASFCRHDQECPGFQRCCETGVGCKRCMDTVSQLTCETSPCEPGFHCVMLENNNCTSYPCFATPSCIKDKPGMCPVVSNKSLCPNQCKVDTHCQGEKKCCGAGGCNVCVDPDLASTLPSSLGGLPTLSNMNMANLPGFGSFLPSGGLDNTQTNLLGATPFGGGLDAGVTGSASGMTGDPTNQVQGGLFPSMNLGGSVPGGSLASLQTTMQNMQNMMSQMGPTSPSSSSSGSFNLQNMMNPMNTMGSPSTAVGGSMTSMFGSQPSSTHPYSVSGNMGLGGPQLTSSGFQSLSDNPQQNPGGLVPSLNPFGNMFGGNPLGTNLQQQQQQPQQRQNGFQCGFMCMMMFVGS